MWCIHREQVSSAWAVSGYAWGSVRGDVGLAEEEVCMYTSLLLAMERDGAT